MPYLVGVDEAGYGPNLGPLVISLTAWHVPDEPWRVDLYQRLSDTIAAAAGDERIAVADSKVLYRPGAGLSLLERGVLPAVAAIAGRSADLGQLWSALEADPHERRHRLPWHQSDELPLPVGLKTSETERLTARLSNGLQAAGVRLATMRSRAVFPEEFNMLVEARGTKGAALSHLTMQLLAETLLELADEPLLAVCDKHGGRNRYGPLLQEVCGDQLVEVHGESRAESVYCWGPDEARVEIRFKAKGETFLPVALASMISKYLRELSMRSFNEFWQRRLPNLRPTAGYPTDARRFKREIAPVQRELHIEDRVLWRTR